MKNIKSGVGVEGFAVGGGGGQAVQFFQGGEFFGSEALGAFGYEFTQDVGADGVQGFLLLFCGEAFEAGNPAAHGAFRQVDGVDEGLLFALVEDVLDVFGELFGEFCSSRENLSH